MEGLRARLVARVGPLPVWAWAALILVAVIGFMYWKKIGFFAPGGKGSAEGGPDGPPIGDNLPGGVGGIAGAGGGLPITAPPGLPGDLGNSSDATSYSTATTDMSGGAPPGYGSVTIGGGTYALPSPISQSSRSAITQAIQAITGGGGGSPAPSPGAGGGGGGGGASVQA